MKTCPKCEGKGVVYVFSIAVENPYETCPRCRGSGRVPVPMSDNTRDETDETIEELEAKLDEACVHGSRAVKLLEVTVRAGELERRLEVARGALERLLGFYNASHIHGGRREPCGECAQLAAATRVLEELKR